MIEPVKSDDDLQEEMTSVPGPPDGQLEMWWLGQSGFFVRFARGRSVLIDPYLSDSLTEKYASTPTPHVRMTRRPIDPNWLPTVDVVTSSHNHTDHLDAPSIVPALMRGPMRDVPDDSTAMLVPSANVEFAAARLRLLVARLTGIDAGQVVRLRDIEFHAIAAAHPALERDPAGRCKCLGYVARHGGFSLYHSGDTVVYPGMVEALRPLAVDVAILPINGKVGNMGGADAAWLAKEIGAKVVIPCHYEMFEFNTASPTEFVAECERLGQRYRVLKCGERFTWPEVTG